MDKPSRPPKRTSGPMVNVTLRLPEADRDQIEWYAHVHRISFSRYMQDLVRDHIQRNLDEQTEAMRSVRKSLEIEK